MAITVFPQTFPASTPAAVLDGVARRVRTLRLQLDMTQADCAARSGMSLSAYRAFERTGDIPLRRLVAVASVLGRTDEFEQLFEHPAYASITDVLQASTPRQRGHSRG